MNLEVGKYYIDVSSYTKEYEFDLYLIIEAYEPDISHFLLYDYDFLYKAICWNNILRLEREVVDLGEVDIRPLVEATKETLSPHIEKILECATPVDIAKMKLYGLL